MKIVKTSKLPYQAPVVAPLGNASKLVQGNGSTWTDSLGNTSTRYGS
ncbi:MAG: hypothetical protein ABI142_06015 [Bryocella sp.]